MQNSGNMLTLESGGANNSNKTKTNCPHIGSNLYKDYKRNWSSLINHNPLNHLEAVQERLSEESEVSEATDCSLAEDGSLACVPQTESRFFSFKKFKLLF